MIKHILKIIWNERKHNVMIVLELLIISVVLWYVVDIMYSRTRNYMSPTGVNIENTFLVSLSEIPEEHPLFNDEITEDEKYEALLDILSQIKKIPDVESVSLSFLSRPGSPGSTQGGAYIQGMDMTNAQQSVYKNGTPDFLDVYEYEPIGSSRAELKQAVQDGKILVSAEFGQFAAKGTNESIIGDTVYADPELTVPLGVIGGVFKAVRDSRFGVGQQLVFSMFNKDTSFDFWTLGIEFSIRVRPDVTESFAQRFEKNYTSLCEVANYRFHSIQYNPDQFQEKIDELKNQYLLEGGLLLFFLINILLGVSGIFWYRSVQRRSQIGLRISFGATPLQSQRQFLLEGLLMFIIAFIGAMIIMEVLFILEIPSVELIPLDMRRYIGGLLITFILMLSTILLAVWLPTRKIRLIPPAKALRDE